MEHKCIIRGINAKNKKVMIEHGLPSFRTLVSSSFYLSISNSNDEGIPASAGMTGEYREKRGLNTCEGSIFCIVQLCQTFGKEFPHFVAGYNLVTRDVTYVGRTVCARQYVNHSDCESVEIFWKADMDAPTKYLLQC